MLNFSGGVFFSKTPRLWCRDLSNNLIQEIPPYGILNPALESLWVHHCSCKIKNLFSTGFNLAVGFFIVYFNSHFQGFVAQQYFRSCARGFWVPHLSDKVVSWLADNFFSLFEHMLIIIIIFFSKGILIPIQSLLSRMAILPTILIFILCEYKFFCVLLNW